MLAWMAVVLMPMMFTAPADTLGSRHAGSERVSCEPVHAYLFHRLDHEGGLVEVPGYADSTGNLLLSPHAPGTRETVWLAPGPGGEAGMFFVLSQDADGNTSAPSNGCQFGAEVRLANVAPSKAYWTALDVPVLLQSRERCGQAALTMVLRYYNASSPALSEVDAAYDPVLHGSLITDLAGAAQRAGYAASVETLTPEKLIDLLNSGVPPILLYQSGSGPVTYRHFGVVTGWDGANASFILHDGTAKPCVTRRDDLLKRWETAGSQALVVRQRMP